MHGCLCCITHVGATIRADDLHVSDVFGTRQQLHDDRAQYSSCSCSCVPEIWHSSQTSCNQVSDVERESIRQQIATTATKLLQAPETHAASLRYLVSLTSSSDDKVSCHTLRPKQPVPAIFTDCSEHVELNASWPKLLL